MSSLPPWRVPAFQALAGLGAPPAFRAPGSWSPSSAALSSGSYSHSWKPIAWMHGLYASLEAAVAEISPHGLLLRNR